MADGMIAEMSFLADQMKKMIRCLSIAALLMGGN